MTPPTTSDVPSYTAEEISSYHTSMYPRHRLKASDKFVPESDHTRQVSALEQRVEELGRERDELAGRLLAAEEALQFIREFSAATRERSKDPRTAALLFDWAVADRLDEGLALASPPEPGTIEAES